MQKNKTERHIFKEVFRVNINQMVWTKDVR